MCRRYPLPLYFFVSTIFQPPWKRVRAPAKGHYFSTLESSSRQSPYGYLTRKAGPIVTASLVPTVLEMSTPDVFSFTTEPTHILNIPTFVPGIEELAILRMVPGSWDGGGVPFSNIRNRTCFVT